MPVKSEAGVSCITICSTKSPWLVRALSTTKGKREVQDIALALKTFEKHVRSSVGSAAAAILDGSQPAGQEKSKKRKLMVDSDDEREGGGRRLAASRPRIQKAPVFEASRTSSGIWR